MGRGSLLSYFEKGQILAKKEQGLSNRRIARDLGRSHTVVDNFIKNPEEYGTRRSAGRPSLLFDRDKRRILREASNSTKSCLEIRSSLNLNASKDTVWRVIRKSQFIVKRKMRKAPFMTKKTSRKSGRFFSLSFLLLMVFVLQVVFSDEKKFNCDGPDGNRFYWHDLRKEKLHFSRRNFKGGGVMVWAAISSSKRIRLCSVPKKMNSSFYRTVMQRELIPFWRQNRHRNLVFMQDNAPIHVSRSSQAWFSRHRIPLLPWPANSPDLNPMENVWGFMVRRIYAQNKRFAGVEELKKGIIEAWHQVAQELTDNF
ncbi:hypothetical protein V3C99_008891 [Haemonchus contortus]|uniref:DDE_3 domain-containing protein n=1 Tax=Haemonchus contortus TaxID=6289 RepID=A0A7I5EAT6_HAECO